MAKITADRVLEQTTTVGVGAIALIGAVPGYRAFAAVLEVGDTCDYVIESAAGDWEVGLGTYTAPNTLTRTTVRASSNADALVNFSGDLKRVMLAMNADSFDERTAEAVEAATQLAEDWAEKLGGTVDGAGYSAKYHAQQAAIANVDGVALADTTDPTKGSARIGHQETGSTIKSLLDARPYCENVRGLRLFAKAMDKYRAASVGVRRSSPIFNAVVAPNSRFGVAMTGDSVAAILSDGILERMFERYDVAGIFGISPYSAYAITPTGTVVDHSALPVDQAVMGGVAGKADFTYLPSGAHYTLEAGATITFNVGQSARWNDVQAYFAKGPGFGSADVEILNEAGSATIVGPTNTGALAAGAIGATHVTLAVPTLATKIRIKVTAVGGPVVLLAVMPRRTNGVIYVPMARGGSTLEQSNYADKTILSYIATQCNIVLATLHAKEENAPVNVAPWMNTLDTYLPNASKIVMGSSPDSSAAATQITIKNLFRTEGLSRDWVYVDGYRLGKDYATQVAAGMMSDGTHPNTFFTEIVARHVWGECGFGAFYAPLSSLPVLAPSVNASSIGVTTINNVTLEVLAAFGGGDPTKATAHNLREVYVGGSRTDANASKIAGYGTTEMAVLDKDDAFTKGFRARYFNAHEATAVSNFTGEVRLNGGCQITSYTVATLPTANAGRIVYVSNGRKVGEGVGAGSGVFAYSSGAQWRRCSDDTPVAA